VIDPLVIKQQLNNSQQVIKVPKNKIKNTNNGGVIPQAQNGRSLSLGQKKETPTQQTQQ
jgi:hypothetical protein